MKKQYNLKTVFTIFLCVYTSGIFSQNIFHEYQDGKIWFKLKNEQAIALPKNHSGQDRTPYLDLPLNTLSFIQELSLKYNITKLSQPFVTIKSSQELLRTYELHFSDVGSVEEIIKEIIKSGKVEYAEKVPYNQLVWTPNDPQFVSNQWGLVQISSQLAWNISLGNAAITVATVDNAVQTNHADLQNAMWVNPGEIAGNGIDDDGNGYIDDINGFDVADNDNNPNPPSTQFSHGTHVAGITGASTNNGVGVASIGAGISIIGVKATGNNDNSNSITNGYAGITYAAAAGARVINCSWGGTGFSQTAQNIINSAWNSGSIIVAAAGNDNVSTLFYPAAYNNVISVASTTTNDVKSSFSNYGAWVDVSAPGSTIMSTTPFGNYANMSGTSMASPMVAGLLGLMLSHYPTMANNDVITCLLSTCKNINTQNPNYIGLLGAGRIDAYAALQCVDQAKTAPPTVDFVADITEACKVPQQVKFTNNSFNANTFLWDFGNGSTSTQTNPTHFYTQSGTYNVKLVATGNNGVDSLIKNMYIVINTPQAPTAIGDTICENQTATLIGTGNGTLRWFDAPTGGTLFGTGNTYTTPSLSVSKAYYVEDIISGNTANVGPINNSFGGGGYHNNGTSQYLVFDVLKPCTLSTAWVNANSSGSRTFTLLNSSGVVLQTVNVNVSAGQSTINLNIPLTPGTGYRIGGNNMDLYRNNAGVNYPYTLNGVLNITGSSAGAAFYYYLYNWEIKEDDCISERTPVEATVISCVGVEEFISGQIFLYPNPAKENITLEYVLKESGNIQFSFYDITGKKIINSEIVDGVQGMNKKQFNITSLSPSFYFLHIQKDNRKKIFKVIVSE
ncbi:MAG: S8 family serine peptidase [Flavobacteriales bacterium]|nr:S8 family serine peptidase [Flavobacteriales bacterium]